MSENAEERETSRRWLVLQRALVPLACLLVAAQAVTIPILFSMNSARVRDIAAQADRNCARLHAVVKVGGEIIAGGKVDLKKFRDEGTISQSQYVRGVEGVDARLARWNSADCVTRMPPPSRPTP